MSVRNSNKNGRRKRLQRKLTWHQPELHDNAFSYMSRILCLNRRLSLLTLSCSGFRLSAKTGSSPSPLSPLCMTNLRVRPFLASAKRPFPKSRNLDPSAPKKRRNSHSTSGNGSVELINMSWIAARLA